MVMGRPVVPHLIRLGCASAVPGSLSDSIGRQRRSDDLCGFALGGDITDTERDADTRITDRSSEAHDRPMYTGADQPYVDYASILSFNTYYM